LKDILNKTIFGTTGANAAQEVPHSTQPRDKMSQSSVSDTKSTKNHHKR